MSARRSFVEASLILFQESRRQLSGLCKLVGGFGATIQATRRRKQMAIDRKGNEIQDGIRNGLGG